MKKDSFILATDYKSSFFSAVFSFEANSLVFNSLDKYDLLHAYMVGEIIRRFELVASSETEKPIAVEGILEQIKNIVKSIKKSGVGGVNPEKRISESSDIIKRKYPIETAQIDSMLQDDTGFVFSSFFVPVILSDLLREFELYEDKNKKTLAHIDIKNNFLNNDIDESAILFDLSFDLLKKMDSQNSEESQVVCETAKNLIKSSIEVHLVTTGQLDIYEKYKEAQEQKIDRETD